MRGDRELRLPWRRIRIFSDHVLISFVHVHPGLLAAGGVSDGRGAADGCNYTIQVGGSSQDIALKSVVNMQ
jgi:hypothetical protein